MGPTDQVWSLREVHVRDADANKLVFAQLLKTE